MAIGIILVVGWPLLIIFIVLLIIKGLSFYRKLKDQVIGKAMIPAGIGWVYGLVSLGVVSTGYMLCVPWYYLVIPAFFTFMIIIVILLRVVNNLEKEAAEIKLFYENLEKLVKERTAELEEAHEKAIRHEKEIQELKDQFVFIAAHELRTPVTAINWGLETVLTSKDMKIEPEMKNLLIQVQSSNQRLIQLVDDLLNVARIESGTIKLEPKIFNLNKTIKNTIDEMESVFKEKPVTVNYKPIEAEVYADENRVKQVLINLLSNATKYNREKGIVDVTVELGKSKVTVSVSDTGFGIKEKDMEKLFTKFGRVKDLETQDIPGTGLGLFLSKEIVEKSGGEISAKSEHGKGSVFTFTLPVTKR